MSLLMLLLQMWQMCRLPAELCVLWLTPADSSFYRNVYWLSMVDFWWVTQKAFVTCMRAHQKTYTWTYVEAVCMIHTCIWQYSLATCIHLIPLLSVWMCVSAGSCGLYSACLCKWKYINKQFPWVDSSFLTFQCDPRVHFFLVWSCCHV